MFEDVYVIASYYTPTEGVSYLLCELPRVGSARGARAVNTILPRIRRIVTGLSPINALHTKNRINAGFSHSLRTSLWPAKRRFLVSVVLAEDPQ